MTLTWLVGVVPPAISFVWGLFAHTDASKLESAAAVPGVQKIVVDTRTATEAVYNTVKDESQPKIVATAN
jgi:hypothetical protein